MAESTRQRYNHTVKSFEDFLTERGVAELVKMDRPFIEAYKVWRRARIMERKFSRNGRGLSLDVAILHGVFTVAVENEMVPKNPVRMEGRPGDNPEAGAQPFDADALGKLRKFAGADNLAFLLLRWTGLRGSDAIKLTWEEISFERKEIERITQKRGKRVIVPLNAELLFALEAEHLRVQPKSSARVLLNPNTLRPMTPPGFINGCWHSGNALVSQMLIPIVSAIRWRWTCRKKGPAHTMWRNSWETQSKLSRSTMHRSRKSCGTACAGLWKTAKVWRRDWTRFGHAPCLPKTSEIEAR